MTSRWLIGVVAMCGVSAPIVGAQTAVNIHVSHPRPLETALNELERTLGVAINYEDPRFECSADVEDVTDRVQSPAQRAANPRARIIVPKGGPLGADAIVTSQFPTIGDALSVVTQLRVQHEANGYPGRFTVIQVGSVITVEPSAVRSSDCTWKPSVPAMETHVTFSSQPRDATEALNLILGTLSQRLGIKVGLGSVPMLGFVNRAVTLGASDEPANVVLVRLFEQLSEHNAIPAVVNPYYSYHLLYDPGVKYYLLHISAVRPMITQTQPNAIAPPPPPQGAFGSKPVKP